MGAGMSIAGDARVSHQSFGQRMLNSCCGMLVGLVLLSADEYAPAPPSGTYRLRVPASRAGYVPDAQGGLPPGPTYCTYGVHVPASGVGYVPGTVAPHVPRLYCPLFNTLGFVRDKRLMKYYLNGSDAYRLKVWFPNHREG